MGWTWIEELEDTKQILFVWPIIFLMRKSVWAHTLGAEWNSRNMDTNRYTRKQYVAYINKIKSHCALACWQMWFHITRAVIYTFNNIRAVVIGPSAIFGMIDSMLAFYGNLYHASVFSILSSHL